MWGHVGFFGSAFGLVIGSLAAMFWFAVAVVVCVLVVLLARFLWFGTRAAKVYLEEHGHSSRFSLYGAGPATSHAATGHADAGQTDAGHPDPGQTDVGNPDAGFAAADYEPTRPYPANGWQETSETAPSQEAYAADGTLPAWPTAEIPVPDREAPTTVIPVEETPTTDAPTTPRTPLKPRTASGDEPRD